MPFLPDTAYGVAYVVALAIAGFVTLAGEVTAPRRILAVMLANWVAVRWLGTTEAGPLAGIVLSSATTLALAMCGAGRAGNASAILFALIVVVDHMTALSIVSNEQAGAASDLLGYLILIVMAGTAHGQGRRFGLGRSAAHRHHEFTGPVALRSEAAPRSGLPD